MGLDMYINAKKYVSTLSSPEMRETLISALVGQGFEPAVADNIKYVEFEVAYWRKANAIHKWFVDNVQDGTDDCGNYDVGQDALKALITTCKTVLADHSRATELLPAQAGFFFGGTEYDEWYFAGLKKTIDMLEPLLDPKFEDFEMYYHSSW